MAETLHVIVDSIGRDISVDSTQWEELKQSITKGMRDVVGEVAKVIGDKSKEKDDKIGTILNTINDSFVNELNDLKKLMGEIRDNLKNVGTGKASTTLGSADPSTALQSIVQNTSEVSGYIKEFKPAFTA